MRHIIFPVFLFALLFSSPFGCGGGGDSSSNNPNSNPSSPSDSNSNSSVSSDAQVPTGNIVIDNNDLTTVSHNVMLHLDATDNNNIVAYYVSESSTAPAGDAAGWVNVTPATSYAGDIPLTLSDGGGTKTVYAWFKDEAGNVSTSSSGSIDVWSFSTIDNSGYVIGRFSSIAIDSNNNVHISYYDKGNDDLKYATNVSGAWITTTIDATGRVGDHTSIAVDSNNKVHISYHTFNPYSLKYATNVGGAWVTTTLDSSIAGQDGYNSIVVDSNDKIHISYVNYVGGTAIFLKYATNVGGAWVTTTLDSSTWDVGKFSSIAVDSNDKIHISYYDTVNGDLKYATNLSGAWVITTPDATGNVGKFSSIAVDSNDKIHISYYDTTNNDLRYATNASGGWGTAFLYSYSAGGPGAHTSIAVDSNDKVHISFYDSSDDNLIYATNLSGAWMTTRLDSLGNMDADSSIALDSNNKIHISYYDSQNGGLKYATTAP